MKSTCMQVLCEILVFNHRYPIKVCDSKEIEFLTFKNV